MLTRAIDLFPLWAIVLSTVAYFFPAPFGAMRELITPLLGLVMLGLCCVFAATGALRTAHAERVEMVSWYWHFVDGVWVVVLTVVYLMAR